MSKYRGICREGDYRSLKYTEDRWNILSSKRSRAKEIMEKLVKKGYKPFVYGSLARGDVNLGSDIDITLLNFVDPSMIETFLFEAGYEVTRRFIVMATPRYTPKAYLWLDTEGKEQVSLFISRPRGRSVDFYRFGGILDYNGIVENRRVRGVDKRLMMIEPVPEGHLEWCIIGREGEAASLLDVSQEIVNERVRVLTRRSKVGHTGVFIEYELGGKESFSEAINNLKRTNRFFRKIIED